VTASSLYRQWRPDRFREVVGQEHVVTTLANAIARDQVAHAYIFAGPRGTGKTTVARLLAKSVNCQDPKRSGAEPCNDCEACQGVRANNSLNVVEMDAASHRGIDDIRELQERVPYANPNGRFRIYILDEAHMLTPEAFNALLKTLEEPPSHVIFVLCTTEPHKIPVTIQSRCQRFDFRFLTVLEIVERLEKVVRADDVLDVEEAALWAIAISAEGSVRDALGLLEQCRDYSGGRITERDVRTVTGAVSRSTLFQYVEKMGQGDVGALLGLVEDVLIAGADISQFIRELLSTYRDMLLMKASRGYRKPMLPQDDLDRMAALVEGYTLARLMAIVDALADAEGRARYVSRPAFLLEMTTIRLADDMHAGARVPSDVSEVGSAGESSSDTGDSRGAEADDTAEEAQSSKRDTPTARQSVDHNGTADDQPAQTAPAPALDAEQWERIKELVRQANMPAYALLQPARPGPAASDRLLLVFQDGFSYHKERTERENYELLQKAVTKVLGEAREIRCVFESEIDPGVSPGGWGSNPAKHRTSDAEAATRRDEATSTDSAHLENEVHGQPQGAANVEDDPVNAVLRAFNGTIVGKVSEFDIPKDQH